jgi:5'-methylthioadenosine phosphorylase
MRNAVSWAVIGGTGFYEMKGIRDVEEVHVQTPFGSPSDAILLGKLGKSRVAFLARHGTAHHLLPSEIPQRANMWALASLGVQRVISISAVGSLAEEIAPGEIVLPDQLVDRTSGLRPSTFFGSGVVGHVDLADPFCAELSRYLSEAADRLKIAAHRGGTLVVIEGPAFSTRAESRLYRQWGASIVGMTASPEARLAREAGMCYANLACVTDYDTWHAGYSDVKVSLVIENLEATVESAKAVLLELAHDFPQPEACSSCAAQPEALLTRREGISDLRGRELAPILERYYRDDERAAYPTKVSPRRAHDDRWMRHD